MVLLEVIVQSLTAVTQLLAAHPILSTIFVGIPLMFYLLTLDFVRSCIVIGAHSCRCTCDVRAGLTRRAPSGLAPVQATETPPLSSSLAHAFGLNHTSISMMLTRYRFITLTNVISDV